MLIAKLHEFADKIGVKPVVVDLILAAVVAWVAKALVSGTWDLDELETAIGLVILGLIGVAAPPAQGVTQDVVLREKSALQAETKRRSSR